MPGGHSPTLRSKGRHGGDKAGKQDRALVFKSSERKYIWKSEQLIPPLAFPLGCRREKLCCSCIGVCVPYVEVLVIHMPFAGALSVRGFGGFTRPGGVGDGRFPTACAHKDGGDLKGHFQKFFVLLLRWRGRKVLSLDLAPSILAFLCSLLGRGCREWEVPNTTQVALGSSVKGTASQARLGHGDLVHGLGRLGMVIGWRPCRLDQTAAAGERGGLGRESWDGEAKAGG